MPVRGGPGPDAEKTVVQLVFGNMLSLTAALNKVHVSGDSVTVLPQSMLRAVRAISVNFTAIGAVRDRKDGEGVQGHGRATAHDMDYRILELQKLVQLGNTGMEAPVTF